MSFCTTFAELRRRRRIPMRGFEHVKIPSSYIHAIEKESVVPGAEKMDRILRVFREVAKDQRADPEEDAWVLLQERALTRFERNAVRMVRDLKDENRPELVEPLEQTLELLDGMDIYDRARLAEQQLPDLVEALPAAVGAAVKEMHAAEGSSGDTD